jgi:nuclease S1
LVAEATLKNRLVHIGTLGQMQVALVVLVLSATPNSVRAWGTQGHQVVANLAQAQLSAKAKREVDRLLALEPGETLASISTWADEHRSPATAAWHYVNFPKNSCTYSAERDCPDGQCVVDAIDLQRDILASTATDEARLRALKYLVHLVADIHQPLHAGYGEDRGGNSCQLQAFMRGTNLHAFWDSGLIRALDQDTEVMTARLASSNASTVKRQELERAGGTFKATQVAEESCRIVGQPGFYPGRLVDQVYVQRLRLSWNCVYKWQGHGWQG